jgi:outer membrane protein OmpA-like peptidoglycan-associated protein
VVKRDTPPAIQVLKPENEDQKKAQIRQTLAKAERDAPNSSDLGYYLDVLQGRLNQAIGPGMTTRGIDNIRTDLTHRLKFAADGAQLAASDRDALLPLANVLAEYKTTLVSVRVGAVDTDAEAMRLASQRAQALARYLSDSGVAAKHIVVVITAQPGGADNPPKIELVLEPILRAAPGAAPDTR